VREKYCWLNGDWWLMLNWCERKALLAGNQPAEQGLYGLSKPFSSVHAALSDVMRLYRLVAPFFHVHAMDLPHQSNSPNRKTYC
jgi:hypothetical protein